MKSENGQSLVEFALTLPVLILLFLGIVDFGRVFYVYLTMNNAGRETAREASIGKLYESEIQQFAVNHFNQNILNMDPLTSSDVKPLEGETNFFIGSDVAIEIHYEVTFLTPFIGEFFDEKPIINKTIMRVEKKKK